MRVIPIQCQKIASVKKTGIKAPGFLQLFTNQQETGFLNRFSNWVLLYEKM